MILKYCMSTAYACVYACVYVCIFVGVTSLSTIMETGLSRGVAFLGKPGRDGGASLLLEGDSTIWDWLNAVDFLFSCFLPTPPFLPADKIQNQHCVKSHPAYILHMPSYTVKMHMPTNTISPSSMTHTHTHM